MTEPLIFHPLVDNLTRICAVCNQTLQVGFEGPEQNFGLKIFIPCQCRPTPPDRMLPSFCKLMIFKAHQDGMGRIQNMRERGIRK